MTLAELRKLAKAKGCKVRACRCLGGWFVYTYVSLDSTLADPKIEAQHPQKPAALRMLALGLRAAKAGKR